MFQDCLNLSVKTIFIYLFSPTSCKVGLTVLKVAHNYVILQTICVGGVIHRIANI